MTEMTEPLITYYEDGSLSMLKGAEAVDLMRVSTIISGIQMNIETNGKMVLTRGANIMHLLTLAGEYTGKKYKRTQKKEAMDDLNVWFQTMKSSIPTATV